MFDTIIIGSGPAGMTAAIYAARACLKTLLIEKAPMAGGQMVNTAEIDNYPALPDISGFALAQKMSEHLKKFNIEIVRGTVSELEVSAEEKKLTVNGSTYRTRTLIAAMGAVYRKLGVAGEEALKGRGVSYCATCDGAFFRGKTAAVVGGGNVALEDALYLSNICRKVYLIHRRNSFRGEKMLQEKVFRQKTIEILTDTTVSEILGEEKVESLCIKRVTTMQEEILPVDGVFIAVGMEPSTELLAGKVELDEHGYVLAGENCRSSVEGVYAVGDIRQKPLRQIVTAAADGANAVYDIEKCL